MAPPPRLLFAQHGWDDDGKAIASLAQQLLAPGDRLIAPSLNRLMTWLRIEPLIRAAERQAIEAAERSPQLPWYVIGHSMGGLIWLEILNRHREWWPRGGGPGSPGSPPRRLGSRSHLRSRRLGHRHRSRFGSRSPPTGRNNCDQHSNHDRGQRPGQWQRWHGAPRSNPMRSRPLDLLVGNFSPATALPRGSPAPHPCLLAKSHPDPARLRPSQPAPAAIARFARNYRYQITLAARERQSSGSSRAAWPCEPALWLG